MKKSDYIKNLVNIMNEGTDESIKARNLLFEEVSPYVGFIINKYYGTFRSEYYDMHQEGCLAVLECLERYNPEKAALTTYVTPYIRERLSKMVSENVHKTNKYYSKKIRKVKDSINSFNIQNLPWTASDIALDTDMSEKSVKQTLEQIDALDKLFSMEEEPAVMEARPKQGTPEDDYIKEQTRMLVNDAVASLPEVQRKIIIYSFGFESRRPMKVPAIAEVLDLPESVVRKELYSALDTLKKKPRLHSLFYGVVDNSEEKLSEAREAFLRF